MEDRELLELAAKAAGVEYDKDCKSKWGLWLIYRDEPSEYARRYWNPLADDGDALRLAVRLNLSIFRPGESPAAQVVTDDSQAFYSDKCVRKAIVIAASAVGRAMP